MRWSLDLKKLYFTSAQSIFIAFYNWLVMRYNNLTEHTFCTEKDDTRLEFSASNSSITLSCCAGVPPSGQLRRESSLLLEEQHAAAKGTNINMRTRLNMVACPRT
jgi:hypothetical protein